MALPLPPTCAQPHSLIRPITSGKAVLAAVLGLLSFGLGVVASVPAFVCAARAIGEMDRDPARLKGRGLALAGIFAAGLGLFLQPVLLLFGVQVARDRVARATDAANLRRIGEAMHAYNDDRGHLPPAVSKDANGGPLLSWRVALLPYLGEQGLYEQFHLDEPWDSPHNFALIEHMPKVYAHPADLEGAAQGLTHYRVFVGEGTPFSAPNGPRLEDFAGQFGTSRRILVATATISATWTRPDELLYAPPRPVPRLGGLLRDGYNVLLANGETRFVREEVISEEGLRRAIVPEEPW